MVRPKILLQKLWRFELDWDTPINPESDLHTDLKVIEYRNWLMLDSRETPQTATPQHLTSWIYRRFWGCNGNGSVAEIWTPRNIGRGTVIWLHQRDINSSERVQYFKPCCCFSVWPSQCTMLFEWMFSLPNCGLIALPWYVGYVSFRSNVACRVGEITSEFNPFTDITWSTQGRISCLFSVNGIWNTLGRTLYEL
jgi:hypothetical protein